MILHYFTLCNTIIIQENFSNAHLLYIQIAVVHARVESPEVHGYIVFRKSLHK